MKKNKNMKVVAFISLISVILLASTATFAWFYMNSDVEIDYGSDIVCETGSSLEISMLEGVENEEEVWSTWSSSVKIEGLSAKLQDITGNGINLLTPSSLITDDNGNLVPTSFVTSSQVDKETGFGDYIELELKLRSTSMMNVYFGGESSILPIDVEGEISNVFGNFTQNNIAGAMRLAVIEQVDETTQDLKMIWAPNPNFELSKDEESQYSFTDTGAVEQYKYYKYNDEENNTFELYNVTPQEIVNNEFVIGSTNTDDATVNQSPILTKIVPDETGYGEAHLIVRVWFEGCDREADQALSGGHCKMKFVFSGIEEKEEATAEKKSEISNISYELSSTSETVDEETITTYSIKWNNITDNTFFTINGYEWIKYQKNEDGSDNIPNLYQMAVDKQENISIFFKTEETLANYAYIEERVIPYEQGGSE